LSCIFRASSGFQQFDIYNLILEILFLMQSVDYELKPKHGIVQKRVSFGMILYYLISLLKTPFRAIQYETLDFR
ncbi:hypothetical protein D5R81_19430, partial [Parashewanella spongiae]